jgi:hypothetical protein
MSQITIDSYLEYIKTEYDFYDCPDTVDDTVQSLRTEVKAEEGFEEGGLGTCTLRMAIPTRFRMVDLTEVSFI